MGLRPWNDTRQIGVLTIRHRPAFVAPLLRILPLSGLLLPLFLERLLAYPLRLGRPGSICHPRYFKASAAARVVRDWQRGRTPVVAGIPSLGAELHGNLLI